MLHSPEAKLMEMTDDEVQNPTAAEAPDESENEEVMKGKSQRFTKPHRCVLNLSALPNLTVMYPILLSIAVTSCSAERTMNHLKIVKTLLWIS
ncbi:hypothetical protein PR048_019039, partial [Dryococelus australis]